MKLDDYIHSRKIKAKVFAKAIQVSEGYLSALRRHGKWPSREIMERISRATNGQVMPNDFIDISTERKQ